MRKWKLGFLAALLAVPLVFGAGAVIASPSETWSGDHFGPENMPAKCANDGPIVLDGPREQPPGSPITVPTEKVRDNVCHHQRLGLNALDSPQIDVLVLLPVQPDTERQMRIVRQSVEMWEGGIDYLADQMGMDWLRDGVDFHITVDYIDPSGENGGEFTTYPVVDPEIVVVATHNNAALFGIGIDPLAQPIVGFSGPLEPANDVLGAMQEGIPCLPVQNPFDISAWENVPGFDSHHSTRGGTYNEDCEGGTGGNVCFAINTTLDTPPELLDVNEMFDLVAHEFGHCLSLGHVGDGAEGLWGVTPTADIMAYSDDPVEGTKCVSTLDVESFAIKMSNFLDVDGDGDVDVDDRLEANSPVGNDGGNPFQVQDPADHAYASSTGRAADCPQPDRGLLPGERTDWTPEPVDTVDERLTVTSPSEGDTSEDGTFTVAGTVERVQRSGDEPTYPDTVSVDDADDDATSDLTELTSLDVAITPDVVRATLDVAALPPLTTDGASGTSYSVTIGGRKFDSFVYGVGFEGPRTYDHGAGAMADGISKWDTAATSVTFDVPRSLLSENGDNAPYEVSASTQYGVFTYGAVDDTAPDAGATVGVGGPNSMVGLLVPQATANVRTVTFEHERGNTFYPEDSSLGERAFVADDPAHHFQLDITTLSDVHLELAWTSGVDGSDLDLTTTAPGSDGGGTGYADHVADGSDPYRESISLQGVSSGFDITVDPFYVTDPDQGATYTLTATITEVADPDTDGDGRSDSIDACPAEPGTADGCPDADGDGVADGGDACPATAGTLADGCPARSDLEVVKVFVDGVLAGSSDVDPRQGRAAFSIPVTVPVGTHELRIVWERRDRVQATATRTVVHEAPADADGDGIPDDTDPDDDNDGYSDERELKKGTDPTDPASHPGRKRAASNTLVST